MLLGQLVLFLLREHRAKIQFSQCRFVNLSCGWLLGLFWRFGLDLQCFDKTTLGIRNSASSLIYAAEIVICQTDNLFNILSHNLNAVRRQNPQYLLQKALACLILTLVGQGHAILIEQLAHLRHVLARGLSSGSSLHVIINNQLHLLQSCCEIPRFDMISALCLQLDYLALPLNVSFHFSFLPHAEVLPGHSLRLQCWLSFLERRLILVIFFHFIDLSRNNSNLKINN